MRRVLVAGIGNIFFGDDAFGVETLRALASRPLPDGVTAHDFGICGHDLAFALGNGYDAAILVDATPQGKEPGTLSVLELEPPSPAADDGSPGGGHSLDPVAVLRLAARFGARVPRLLLVGCEPAELGGDDGAMGLSPAVSAAVPCAVALIESLLPGLLAPDGLPEKSPALVTNP